MEIRKAKPEDFKAVYEFINALENEIMDEDNQRAIFASNLENPDIVYLVAVSGSAAVGFVSLHVQSLLHHASRIGEIQEMFVLEAARGLGVGKQLLSEIKKIAVEMNIAQLEVTSSFKREAAHRFYEREGFRHTHKKFTWKYEDQ